MKLPLPGRAWPSLLLALCLPLFTAGCLHPAEEDGTVSGTGKPALGGGSDSETLTGAVSAPDGSPAVGALVKLIPAAYDPSHPDTALIRRAVTDDSGAFRFGKLDSAASYNVIVGKATEKSWAFMGGLKPGPERKPLALSLAKVFFFSMHAEGYEKQDSGIAYFPGTDILARCGGITASQVDSVPMGVLHFVVMSRAGWQHDTTLTMAADTTKVSAGKSRLILLP
ncbi:MAG TPA: carboxypeptidase-like regulatory domain-containing protein [Fibrobacteria bacterium]|nr:carboxypeptidase-like regulatory domain-containing protein [Fibrobacteria bacterium]